MMEDREVSTRCRREKWEQGVRYDEKGRASRKRRQYKSRWTASWWLVKTCMKIRERAEAETCQHYRWGDRKSRPVPSEFLLQWLHAWKQFEAEHNSFSPDHECLVRRMGDPMTCALHEHLMLPTIRPAHCCIVSRALSLSQRSLAAESVLCLLITRFVWT